MDPYEGTEPFVFISYAHKDADVVVPLLEALGRVGLRLWYDRGIYSGAEWAAKIEQRLVDCDRVLAFVSYDFIESPNCRDEVGFALDEHRPLHLVRLDEAPYAHGLRLRLGKLNYLMYDGDVDALLDDFLRDDDLVPCLATQAERHVFWRPPREGFGAWLPKEQREEVERALASRMGPDRATYENGAFPERWSINSRTDHPKLGDERRFVFVREKDTKTWLREIALKPDTHYEVMVRFRNDGDPSLGDASTAEGLSLSVIMPDHVTPQRHGVVRAALHAIWPQPGSLAPDEEIWSSAALYVSDEPLFLDFVVASAHVWNKGGLDGTTLPTALFDSRGVRLGLDGADGRLPAGDDSMGTVIFEFEAHAHNGDCALAREASVAGGELARGLIEVGSGDIVDFHTSFSNLSDTHLTNVTFKDTLASGLELVRGTTVLRDTVGNEQVMSDLIAKNGYNTGCFGRGVGATLDYRVQVPASELPRNYYTLGAVYHDGGKRTAPLLVHAEGTTSTDPRIVSDPEHDDRYADLLADMPRGGGWGPDRDMHTMRHPAREACFNSIKDNNILGDERNFVRIARHGTHDTYRNRIQVVPGYLYAVYVWYHNAAAPNAGEPGVARDVRLQVIFPGRIDAKGHGKVQGVISASNTTPSRVWADSVLWATEPVVVRAVPGHARLYNGRHDGTVLDERIFSKEGIPLGADTLDGVIASSDVDASGHVIVLLSVEEA